MTLGVSCYTAGVTHGLSMQHHTLQVTFFSALLLVATVLTALVFLPYLPAIFFAIVLAIVFWPLHQRLSRAIPTDFLRALTSTVLVLVIIGIPLALFSFLLFQELSALDQRGGELIDVSMMLQQISETVSTVSPSLAQFLDEQAMQLGNTDYFKEALDWTLDNFTSFFSQVVHIILSLGLALLALFYLFKDGEKGVRFIKDVSPLESQHNERLLDKCTVAVNSVIRGRILASILQGILAGIAFAIFGVPAPVLWGSIAGIVSVVPMLGPGLVITPAIIYLVATGSLWAALGLLIWAFVAVYFIDDILEPVFINRGIEVHPFLILISILGGLALMGPVGFVAGPVILSVFFALVNLYPVLVRGHASS